MARIFTSGNYLICDTPNGTREFAKKITVYHIIGRNIVISENDIKLEIPLSEVTDYTNEAGDTSYTITTLTTFLRSNTGNFSTASGGSEVINTKVTTATYTVQPNDVIVSINAGATVTNVTLPLAASFPGRILYFRREANADNGACTLTAAGSDTIEGAGGTFSSTYSLTVGSTTRRSVFFSDGVNKWCLLSNG